MKLVLNTQNTNTLSEFIKLSKNVVEIIPATAEKMLFDSITVGDVNAFVIDNSTLYAQKSIDLIKKKYPYIPIVVIGKGVVQLNNADIYIDSDEKDCELLFNLIIKNINNYEKNFSDLQRLTSKVTEKISFGNCVYDPTKRTLYYKDKEISKFSEKGGGIIELLSKSYGKPVKKELLLERVWKKKNDYYAMRSMDVYVTGIRKIFQDNGIDLKINNISGVGLILE